MKYYIPTTLRKDFEDWLHTNVPNTNYDFELVRNWYDRNAVGYTPIQLRAMLFSIEWKSSTTRS